MINLKNTKKNRRCTPNEAAKYLLTQHLEGLYYDLDEKEGCENLTAREAEEINRFLVLHVDAIRKRFWESFTGTDIID